MHNTGFWSSLVSTYYRLYARYNMGAIADSVFGRGLMLIAGIAGKSMHHIGLAKDKPWFARESMRSVRDIMPEAEARAMDKFSFPEDIHSLSDLRVAGILDRFSHLSFSSDCKMLPLSTVDWKERIEEFKPHMLLVESAWEGLDESWKWKVSIVSPELVEIIVYCRRNGIPTVFWNKEDPKHFETFIRAAKLFDVIFTTDIDKIPDYQERMGGGRVYLLPFAAQPALHNPVETQERADAFCFAGSYYAKQLERSRAFSRMVRALSGLGKVDIFDRYMNSPDVRLTFPQRFRPFIVGTLDPTDIDRAYKGYYYGLNLNSVTNSQTMFARRALELMASNTVVIGNYSRALSIFLGELTVSTDDMTILVDRVGRLKNEPELRDQYRLAGLRKVMSQHTYRHRLTHMVGMVFDRPLEERTNEVVVISDPKDDEELKSVLVSFQRQRYARKSLHLILPEHISCPEGATRLREDCIPGDLVSYMCPEDAYGPDYLGDLVLAVEWSGCHTVGKGTYLAGREERIQEPGNEYRYLDGLIWRRALIGRQMAEGLLRSMMRDRDIAVKGPVNLSTDRYNYVFGKRGDECSFDYPEFDNGLDLDYISAQIGEGNRGFIARYTTLRAFGRYSKPSKSFRAPYLHLRNRCFPQADVICSSDTTNYYDLDGVEIASLSIEDMAMAMNSGHRQVQFHLMDRSMLRAYEMVDGKIPVEIWIYGPEVELALLGRESGAGKQQRMSTEKQLRADEWISLLKFPGTRYVFTSAFLAKEMERLAGMPMTGRSTITPVVVDPAFEKAAPKRRSGILIAKPHWGAELDLDAAKDILEEMSEDPRFKDLPVTIYGDWSKSITQSKDRRGFENIKFVRELRSPRERAELFASHLLLLMPQKHDYNFAMPLEAMGVGTVPVMNRVGAVPEFLDESCGLTLIGEAKLDACFIWALLDDRNRIERLSKGAAEKAELIRDRVGSS